MRPIYLSFKAFGPYVSKQEIDFEQLEKSGLYLICGQTGSGKTTILDAMSYALYGSSSGGARGDLSAMRCQLADDRNDTEVEYIFEADKKIYKFTRGVRLSRKNFNTSQNVFVKNSDGIFEPIFANPKIKDVEQKAKELIGLTYEQFRQVILLPQGQFEKLLTSKSEEKEAILVSLFNADKWQRAAQLVFEKAKAKKDALAEEFAGIEFVLKNNQCSDISQLEELYVNRCAELSDLKKDAETFEKNLKSERESFEEAKALAAKFDELEAVRREYKILISEKVKQEEAAARIERCDAAFAVKPLYERKLEAEHSHSERTMQLAALTAEQKKKGEALENKKRVLSELESKAADIDRINKQIFAMEALIPIYEDGEKTETLKQNKKLEYEQKEKELARLRQAFESKQQRHGEAKENLSLAIAEYTKAFNLYISSISATLAAKLTEGTPCPVCGSTHHPSPAEKSGTAVTVEVKNQKEAIFKNAEVAEKKAASEVEEASKLFEGKKAEFEKIKSEYDKVCEQARIFEKNKIASIDTCAQLREKTETFKKTVSTYELRKKTASSETERASEAFALAQSAVMTSESELEKSKSQLELLVQKFNQSLKASAFTDEAEMKRLLLSAEEKQLLISSCEKYKNDLRSAADRTENLTLELKEKVKPEIGVLRQQLEVKEAMKTAQASSIAVAEMKLKNLESDFKSLEKRILKYQKDVITADSDMQFARQIRGDMGMGIQRYMLAVMLSAVTGEANKLLAEVHGGRYRLHRTSATADSRTRKSGLELEVFDSTSGESRSVVSLSGGEKFLAALSLSIGLASVVMAQSGGKKLGSMFIDEGFGSLDPSSVNDALAVLSHVKNAKGSVGIISHVDALKETISTRVEITKTSKGSTCKTVIG